MQQAVEIAEQLNARILNSEEYKRYQKTNQALRSEPELHMKFDEFRRKNYDLQFREGDSNLYDEVFNLVKEYDTILQDSRVNEFMLAEQRFSAMMRDVYKTLSKDLELDYEYLEK